MGGLADRDSIAIPGWESYHELRQRVDEFLRERDVAVPGILVVSHLDTLRMLVAVMRRCTFAAARSWFWEPGEVLEAVASASMPLRKLAGSMDGDAETNDV